MQLIHFADAQQYLKWVQPYLLQQEAQHCLLLGISERIIHNREHFNHPPYLVAVEEDNILLAVALRTPPQKLVISHAIKPEALTLIAQDLYSQQQALPGVIGSQRDAQTFVKVWQAITGIPYRLGMQQRIYQLERVQPIPKASGYLRQASVSDRDLLIRWCQAFTEEALDKIETQNIERSIDGYLKNNALYLWQDETPVSVAAFSGSTPNGIRINFVYTPKEYRRQGYASSCVAALSQALLDRGRKYCFLFTDLANPTSNRIYQSIDYQPIGEAVEYWFGG